MPAYKIKVQSRKGILGLSARITIPAEAAKIMGIDKNKDCTLDAFIDEDKKVLTIWNNKDYDFSKRERVKFYKPGAKFNLPK